MSAISNFTAFRRFENGAALRKNLPGVGLISKHVLTTKISTQFQKVCVIHSKRMFRGSNIRMTMVDERLSSGKVVAPSEVLRPSIKFVTLTSALFSPPEGLYTNI
ncbi:hypothetical protein HAX54_034699 [Datura stramonium]|uniref:Uncharacterized protein n=1 Tax=Datura stramonium TaxID=4076 RepID=A0ABS8SEG8_DATST|nr:hypothetical protein [Datura stramonium]